MSTDYVVNAWDVVRRLGIKGVTTGFPYHGRRCFYEIPHNRRPWDRDRNAMQPWAEIAAGREMAYVHVARDHGVWIAAAHADRARQLVDRNGRKLRVTVGGEPCEGETGHGGDTGTCGRPAVGRLAHRDTNESEEFARPLCKRHLSIEEGVRRRDTERQQRWADERAMRTRQQEADRAAREMLDTDADLLEDLGLAHLTTDGQGHVRLSVEQLIGLVRRIP